MLKTTADRQIAIMEAVLVSLAELARVQADVAALAAYRRPKGQHDT